MNAHLALDALLEKDPARKVELTYAAQGMPWKPLMDGLLGAIPQVPGRPEKPHMVHPARVPKRKLGALAGRAALTHAVAHIEFNAINLALDAALRFPHMPEQYYADWLHVAAEEALHFSLLAAHLQTLGFAYGDFEAHDGLWGMALKTRDDVTARMALVPRTLEARGLDATPQIQARLKQIDAPDARAACSILDRILADEVGHVAIGNRWYRFCCERDGLDAEAHYAVLTERYHAPTLHPPFNLEARRRAGFTTQELTQLQSSRSC
jgi:uncharacterized ferritin-like protein (DUF455 family)